MSAPTIVFVDASFYIALMSVKDLARPRALAWNRHLTANGSQFVTTEAILWEWLNFFADPSTRTRCAHGYDMVHVDPQIEVIGFDPVLCGQAVELYASRPDKGWGVVDCLSFTAMRERGLVSALTTDHHFEQAGFKSLMLNDPPA